MKKIISSFTFILVSFVFLTYDHVCQYLSKVIRPPQTWEKEYDSYREFSHAYPSKFNQQDRDYAVICVGGSQTSFQHAATLGSRLQLSEPQKLAYGFEQKEFLEAFKIFALDPQDCDFYFFQPAYYSKAQLCIEDIVNFAEEISKSNKKIILYGYSLGGGMIMQAALELKQKNISVPFIINSRSFSSLGAAAAIKVLASKDTREISQPLFLVSKYIFNCVGAFYGQWDLNSEKALEKIINFNNKAHSELHISKILIAGHDFDSVFGSQANFHRSIKQNLEHIYVFVDKNEKLSKENNHFYPSKIDESTQLHRFC